ncbi:ThiF family adenylyltransferase [Leptolinea tardivitalis]|uniref:ThiF family adenylyltransferase n=1 Tax=Leptolinea tardivitalis TaxID=229920 RepID=UPI0007810EA9|nr:ThiF family adenylyltransferase [Leptolinea tardivitalis]GAP20147.1 dinucleotide-utilizing enzyme [Leptolinea tardivitalis]
MNIPNTPIARKSLAEIIAGKLAASILEGRLSQGTQLAPERDLVKEFGVSRSTLREALKILLDSRLIESRVSVGWFVCEITSNNLARARELASWARSETAPVVRPAGQEPPTGPRRLPVNPEKPLQIPNLKTDRSGTFQLISWWEREKVENARVMVVGAGALGNEVIKNLALMGVGHILIVDFDTIEMANLSRSVLFRESDASRNKAEVAAARAKELNPNIKVQYIHGDITNQIGLGVFRRMDVIIGCLDNREARLALNRFAYWVGKPWVDGAIQELYGLVRVFIPGKGACFECSLTEQARRDLAVRYSCPLLARENVLLGKVPTTPTIASIIGAMQAQEALKIIHGMPVEPGKVTHFNGLTNEMHTSAYTAREDCESHWSYGEITELPLNAGTTTLAEFARIVQADLGPETVIELDQELILSLTCPQCGTREEVIRPMSEVGFKAAHCPVCGILREIEMTHTITGKESFAHLSLSAAGIPPLHVLRAFNALEYRFYELTGDLKDTLHFRHFERQDNRLMATAIRETIRLHDVTVSDEPSTNPAHGRVTLWKD